MLKLQRGSGAVVRTSRKGWAGERWWPRELAGLGVGGDPEGGSKRSPVLSG